MSAFYDVICIQSRRVTLTYNHMECSYVTNLDAVKKGSNITAKEKQLYV